MEIILIKNEDDYNVALAEINRLFDINPAKGTPEFDRADVLATLIHAYEAKTLHIGLPDPIGAIESHLDRLNLTPADLEPLIGSPERVADIMDKRRPLTLPMVHRLQAKLGIGVDILAQPYPLRRVSRRVATKIADEPVSSRGKK